MSPEQRRYLFVECVIGSAIVNALINGGLGWVGTIPFPPRRRRHHPAADRPRGAARSCAPCYVFARLRSGNRQDAKAAKGRQVFCFYTAQRDLPTALHAEEGATQKSWRVLVELGAC